ncbi:MAG: outer membrane protein transport protein [Phascolarctobacterium sp.]|nr:outer membrane protein transport protein [Phascolarctobacterium sp.]
MKKSLLASVTLAALLAPTAVFAEGYGIIEHHAEGVAMGGAAMFIENDAGNMAYNPAGITLCEGQQIKVSATYISPHGYEKSEPLAPLALAGGKPENNRNRVHPAWAPGTYYVKKMDDKQWWGIGCFSRFGNMSEFEGGTLAATNNRLAKMQGLSITPTYARQSGRKFYWAVGADINYVKLEMQKDFAYYDKLGLTPGTVPTGLNQIEGKTWSLGWNAGLRYAATKKDEFGFAYRSKIKHSMDADMNCYGAAFGPSSPFGPVHNSAYGKVTLPDSYHFGYSHRFDDRHRVELSAIRTQWHNFKNLYMSFGQPYLGKTGTNSIHNWKDTWRYAIGYEYKFSKKYTGMLGFAFDDDGIPADGGQFMVPVGIRRTYSAGLKYHDKRHTIALAIAWQKEGNQSFLGQGTDAYKSAHCYDSIAKIFSLGYTYHF